ncbi:CMRF35-like molecule 1 [Carettochelys insculpta]|uniref:CMRF35-like molecule 1 n=1 Tax=Carettochelys insculpta TaxID=44489 RepID=UPI003EBAB321
MGLMQLPFTWAMLLLPGCFSALAAPVLRAPGEARGALGGSVSVPCQYREGYQRYKKYWCRGAGWSTCSKVAETAGTEAEVKSGRVSIRDNRTLSTFTVTMGNLTLEDAGTYWCGINKGGSDPHSLANVTVLPAVSTTATVTTASLSTASSTVSPPANTAEYPQSSSFTGVVLLLPLILVGLVIFLIGAMLLAREMMLKRKEAAGASGTSPGVNEAAASTSTEADVCYTTVKPKPRKSLTTAPPSHSAQAEHSPETVEYSAVAPGRPAISSATLEYPAVDEQPVYSNVDRPLD